MWYIVSLLSLLSLWALQSDESDTYTHTVGYVMCFLISEKCKHSGDPDKLCVFAKRKSDNSISCKLIYPIYSENDDVELLPSCFNEMQPRDQHSIARKLNKIKK